MWIEPGALPRSRHVVGGLHAIGADEDFDGLGEAEDAGEERDLLALEGVRLTGAVPVLVEGTNGLNRLVLKSQSPGDVRTTLAAREDDVARARGSSRQHSEQLPRACEPELTGRNVAGDEAKGLDRARPVGGLQVGLDVMIVGAEEDREASGVARASEVLHQQRVEQRGSLVGGQLEFGRDPHADQTASNGVSFTLSFGQVEGIGQAREHL